MSKVISPYALCYEALRLIELHSSDEMTTEEERQIILLLNKSECYPNMSTYQLSLARKKLAEYYMAHGITGSALDQYQIALTDNPRLPVKKIVKSLSSIPVCDRIYSVDANIAGEPNCDHILFFDPKANVHLRAQSVTDYRNAEFFGMTVEEYRNWLTNTYDSAIKQLQQEAAEEDAIYDPEFDEYVEKQLDLLGEDCRKSFYDSVKLRELESEYEPNIWSYKKWAKQTLDCFWDSKRAADRHAEQLSKASGMDFSNMSLSAARAADLTQTEMLFLQYLHHKKTSLDGIAGYWTHEYHMDYEHVIPKFFSLGFLGYADLEYTLKKCTIAEMTALLPKEDTLVKRKKPELIQFLLSRDDLPSLDAYKKLYFEVTPAGKSYLSGQEYPNKDVSFRY